MTITSLSHTHPRQAHTHSSNPPKCEFFSSSRLRSLFPWWVPHDQSNSSSADRRSEVGSPPVPGPLVPPVLAIPYASQTTVDLCLMSLWWSPKVWPQDRMLNSSWDGPDHRCFKRWHIAHILPFLPVSWVMPLCRYLTEGCDIACLISKHFHTEICFVCQKMESWHSMFSTDLKEKENLV